MASNTLINQCESSIAHGLDFASLALLLYVIDTPSVSPAELVGSFPSIPRGIVYKRVSRMRAMGLLDRSPAVGDQRRDNLRATYEGKTVARRITLGKLPRVTPVETIKG